MNLPSVLLHDHLDGGLRPSTVIELADRNGHPELPANTEEGLSAWFDQSESGSLETYLKSFDYTIAVMQDPDALERIAYEAMIDLSGDGVVYAELRFCPALHTRTGMSGDSVVDAVAAGLEMGSEETGMRWGIIVDTLRQHDWGMAMARLATRMRHRGVVGFDIAGPEAPYPPAGNLAACRYSRESGIHLTIHAGESAGELGVAYMAAAMDTCGAERLGHGVQIIDDCEVEGGEIVGLGSVARRVRDRRVPLEICPSSNLATNGLTPAQHPVGALYRAGFNVTISTDNRLMSNTSMSSEFDFVERHHGFDIDARALTTKRSLRAAFCDHRVKVELWEDLIAPAYASAGASVERQWR